MIDKHAKIYVAGHRGMVGSAIVRRLQAGGYTNLLTRTHAELDLLDQRSVFNFLEREKPDFIFLAAAKVGGIHANDTYRADFIYQNLVIETNIVHGAWRAGIQRLLFLGSSCIYPRDCPQPIREEYLLTGPLEQTNEPYAIAKIAGIKLCESYNRQYGTRYMVVMPTNLYGPNDHYDLANSHVLPALIRKCHLGKLAAQGDIAGIEADEVRHGLLPMDYKAELLDAARSRRTLPLRVWGTGRPRREFLHVDDLADACVFLMERGIGGGLYNIGYGNDITIRELAETVLGVIGVDAEIIFDVTKPDGTPQKLLDVSSMQALGWQAKIGLRDGIRATYKSYLAF